jgi:hypothetical protein
MCGCECKEPEKPEEPEEPEQIEWSLSFLSNAPFVESDDYSEWVLAEMNEISIKLPNPGVFFRVLIFQGEWEDQIVYLIAGSIYSGPMIYSETGKRIIFRDAKGFSIFCDTSANWIKIFDYGQGILPPYLMY